MLPADCQAALLRLKLPLWMIPAETEVCSPCRHTCTALGLFSLAWISCYAEEFAQQNPIGYTSWVAYKHAKSPAVKEMDRQVHQLLYGWLLRNKHAVLSACTWMHAAAVHLCLFEAATMHAHCLYM